MGHGRFFVPKRSGMHAELRDGVQPALRGVYVIFGNFCVIFDGIISLSKPIKTPSMSSSEPKCTLH